MRGVASVYASYLLQQCADVPVEMEDVEHHRILSREWDLVASKAWLEGLGYRILHRIFSMSVHRHALLAADMGAPSTSTPQTK